MQRVGGTLIKEKKNKHKNVSTTYLKDMFLDLKSFFPLLKVFFFNNGCFFCVLFPKSRVGPMYLYYSVYRCEAFFKASFKWQTSIFFWVYKLTILIIKLFKFIIPSTEEIT